MCKGVRVALFPATPRFYLATELWDKIWEWPGNEARESGDILTTSPDFWALQIFLVQPHSVQWQEGEASRGLSARGVLSSSTIMSLIIRTIQLFKHPSSPGKMIIVLQAFKLPCLKLLFQYPNTYTLQRCRWMSSSLRQSLQSYSKGYWTSSSILQAFLKVY